jgi:serine/threonine-protein kinase
MSTFKRLIRDIHRRSVWQVLAVYVLGAAAGFQVIQSLTEGLGLPYWFPSFAVVLFIVLLPVVAATAFIREQPARALEEPTVLDDDEAQDAAAPDRLAAARPVDPRGRFFTWRGAFTSLIGALALWGILAAGYLLISGFPEISVDEDTQLAALRTKLLVLPFENLGPAEDEYFTDGVTEEITSRLAEIPELGVISRTSAIQYKGTQRSIDEIARELDVQYVLEGTVRWERAAAGPSQVRVTPQLIRVSDDTHIWTERYDAVLSEIFQVQSDIAESVARALDITLLEPQRRSLASAPTANLDAYDLFLRGNVSYSDRFLETNALAAEQLYEQATQLDSSFAVAFAALSRARVWLHWQFGRAEKLSAARAAVDQALQIAPNLPDAHMALGDYYYYGEQNFEQALEEFVRVQRRQPGNSDALALIAWILRRQGEWERSIANAERALELDPRNPVWVIGQAQNHYYTNRYAEGEAYFQRSIALAPGTPYNYQWATAFYLAWDGHMERARRTLEDGARHIDRGELLIGPEVAWIVASVFADEYGEAIDSVSLETAAVDSVDYYLTKAMVASRRDRPGRARAYYDSARVVLESRVQEPAGQSDPHIQLGLAYAGLGRAADAIREGEIGVNRTPLSADALVGGERLLDLARIYVMIGEYGAAIEELELVLSVPSVISPALLRLDPTWGPLRDDVRFQRLLEGMPGESDEQRTPVRVALGRAGG